MRRTFGGESKRFRVPRDDGVLKIQASSVFAIRARVVGAWASYGLTVSGNPDVDRGRCWGSCAASAKCCWLGTPTRINMVCDMTA